MNFAKSALVILCIYALGFILYSRLFAFIPIVPNSVQIAKMAVASLFFLVLLIPVYLAGSRQLVLRLLGYAVLGAAFVYTFFLTSYYAYFGFVPEIYALGAANAPDMAGVLGHYFKQVFGLREVLLLVVAVILFAVLPRQKMHGALLILLVLPGLLFAANVMQHGSPEDNKRWGNTAVIKRFGVPTFVYLSAQDWMRFSSGFLAQDTPYPGKLTQLAYDADFATSSPAHSVSTPVDRVALIQIESFDREAIDAVLNGQDVMPFTSNLRAGSCLDYSNYYTVKSVGGSSDSEYSVATGRLPSAKLQSIRSTDFSKLETLYDMLASAGIASSFAHNNTIGYYGRNYAYGQMDSVTTTFIDPGDVNDERAFALETMRAAMEVSQRSFYYFFNFQSHGPFRGYQAETADKFGLEPGSDLISDYMATMHEVDQTIAELFALQSAAFEDGTGMFIVTSDHPSYLHTDDDPVRAAHIPMLICHRDFSGQTVDKLASTVDVYPTILEAFGVTAPANLIADSLMSAGPNVVLFPTGTLLSQQENGDVMRGTCDTNCAPFFDYTNQTVSLSP